MGPRFQRGLLLLDQRRYQDAAKEFAAHLSDYPEDAEGLAFYALCQSQLEQLQPASHSIELALAHDPERSHSHFVKGQILQARNRPEEALDSFETAIDLEPEEPLYLASASFLLCQLKRWQQALDYAERGLELEAGSNLLANARARALVGLGRAEEAGLHLTDRLAADPEDTITHSSLGWVALEKGEREKALDHFQQALLNDPENDWARQGLLEALKLRYPLYRWLLSYFLWMSKLSGGAQWRVILGGYIAYRVLQSLARSNETLGWLLAPFLTVYLLFVYLSWTGPGLTSLLLRFNRYGRRLLNQDEVRQTTWLGFCWLGMAGAAIAQLTVLPGAWLLAVVLLFQAMPVSAIAGCDQGWPRHTMVALCWLVFSLGVAGYGLFQLGSERAAPAAGFYLLTFFVTLIGANFLTSAEVRK